MLHAEVADAIISNDFRAPSPTQFTYACIDTFRIALGASYALRVVLPDRPELVIQTGGSAQQAAISAPLKLGGATLTVLQEKGAPAEESDPSILDGRRRLLAGAMLALRRKSGRVYSRLQRDLEASFVAIALASRSDHDPVVDPPYEPKIFDRMIATLTDAIADVMTEVEQSIHSYPSHPLNLRVDGIDVLNLSLLFRDFRGSGTCFHHVLSPRQHELIRRLGCGQPEPTQLTRSHPGISESATKGFTQVWAFDPLTDCGFSLPIAVAAFASVGHRVGSPPRESPLQCRVMTVPMHLGGLPWLSAVLVLPARNDYRSVGIAIYRDFIPWLFSRLRYLVRRQHVDHVVDTFAEYIGAHIQDLETTNRRLSILGHAYPFPVWQLSEEVAPGEQDDWHEIHAIGNQRLWVGQLGAANPFVSPSKVVGMYHERSLINATAHLRAFRTHVAQITTVQNRYNSSDPCCKRGLCVPGTGILRSRSAASS